MNEFYGIASQFIDAHLPFLDRNWLGSVLTNKLTKLIEQTVKEHTSTTANTALREAYLRAVGLVEHAKFYMPSSVKICRCSELNDGEHKPQPICSWCAIGNIKSYAERALKEQSTVK